MASAAAVATVYLSRQGALTLMRKLAQAALIVARDRSSGTTPTAQLRKEDHPYATRHGFPRRPLLPINAQTGSYKRAWRVVHTHGGAVLINDTPYADYLEDGTKKMFPRKLGTRIAADFDKEARRLGVGRVTRF